ncbi:hypothetical protein ABT160_10260 [Streptomyces sp. NPDC001941]|uniref:hypothetical protein n=1 Tax=Streptomyces sp. NPDC001941 TaxID=3154659 RepID=UPI0033320FCE
MYTESRSACAPAPSIERPAPTADFSNSPRNPFTTSAIASNLNDRSTNNDSLNCGHG